MDAERILQLAITQALQVAVVTIAVAGVVRFSCKRRPHLAYALWLVVLAKCFVPPLWSSPTGIFSLATAQHSDPSVASANLDGPRYRLRQLPIDLPPQRSIQNVPVGKMPTPLPARAGRVAIGRSDPPSVAASPVGISLTGIWLLGILASFGTILFHATKMRSELRQYLSYASPELQNQFSDLRALLGIRQNLPLAIVREPIGPALIGFVRPTIVVPEILLHGHPTLDLRAILAHELIHFRRGDHWIAFAQCVARGIWWFHPAVWFMGRELRRVRELCCDEEVIAALNCEPASYAQSLLNVLLLRRELRPPVVAPGISALEITADRLRHIMAAGALFQRRSTKSCWLMLGVCALVVLPGAGLELTRGAAQTVQPKTEIRAAAQPARDPSWKIVVDNADGQMLSSSMTFHGIVVDHTTGKPVEGATVRIVASDKQPQWGDIEALLDQPARSSSDYSDCSSKTNSKGQYETVVYPSSPRTYLTVDAVASVNCPGYARRVFWGPYLIDLKHGTRGHGDMGFEFAKLELMPAEKITGRMIDQAGGPMAGLKLLVRSRKFEQSFDIDGEPWLTYPAITDKDTPTTDADGRFTAIVAKAADVEISGRTSDPRYLEFTESIGHRRGDIGSLTVLKGPRISVRTVDAAGRPVAGVTVRPCPLAEGLMLWGYEGKTGSDGRYISRAVPPGKYRLNLTDTDCSVGETFRETTVNVPAGEQTSEFQVRTAPHVTITIHVIDIARRPMDTTAIWHDNSGHGSDFITSGPSGILRIRIPRGTENLHFQFFLTDSTRRDFHFRRGISGPAIEPFTSVGDCLDLDRADHDIPDLYAIAYEGADISVSASGPDGHAITDFKPRLHCLSDTNFDSPGPGSFGVVGPGGCYHGWAAPNLPFELEISALGFKTVKQRLQFAEGENRRIDVRMVPKAH